MKLEVKGLGSCVAGGRGWFDTARWERKRESETEHFLFVFLCAWHDRLEAILRGYDQGKREQT